MKPSSRIVGLLVFIALVAAVQICEGLIRWYIHREDRVHLMSLREELIDVGAEMIAAQLDAERLREQLESIDRVLDTRRHDLSWTDRRSPVVLPSSSNRAHEPRRGVSGFNAQILERNRHLGELNGVVARRNSAAVRYYVLADSIRMIAARVQEPYFSIPLPVEAAVQRGILGVVVPGYGAPGDSLFPGAPIEDARSERAPR